MIKAYYPLLTNTTYLNTAYVGLMSTQLAEFRKSHEEFYLKNGGDQYKMKAYDDLDSMHQHFASFFGLTPDRCFGTSNFSNGIRTALSFLPKKMKVLLIEDDYPSLTDAFKEEGFDSAKITMQSQIEEAIKEKLKSEEFQVLALSIVQYTSGLLIDQEFLFSLKKEYPSLIIIGDGTQFLGAHQFHFDKSPFDLVAGSGYKWLLGGFGNGIVMLSKAFVAMTSQKVDKIRERFYNGHFNILGMASLDFAIRELVQHDFQSLVEEKAALSEEAKNQLIADEFLPQWLGERTFHSSIFNINGEEELFTFLQKNNIRCVQRGSGVRVSFHFYNTEKDLRKLLKTLRSFRELNSHPPFN